MASFLLIHGAWHGAWCWERIVPLLRAAGHEVIVPDLPAHGADPTPWWRATLGGYAQRICDAARPAGRVIAVGHSLGGLVVTQAAVREPERSSRRRPTTRRSSPRPPCRQRGSTSWRRSRAERGDPGQPASSSCARRRAS